MRVAVVGHVEWIELARVPEMPAPGAIVHASETWEEPGGGGAVAAVQLAKLAGSATFLTALGSDELGERVHAELTGLGLDVHVAWRPVAQRRAFVHVDAAGERTITVIGDRLGPHGDDDLPWDALAGADAVYLTAGDAAAAERARAARTLVGTARALDTLRGTGIRLDALVASADDAGETYRLGDLDPDPDLIVRTAGAAGGSWERPGGERGEWAATPLPGPVEDAYGCGDSFAAGLAYALGAGADPAGADPAGADPAAATRLAARCGAACLTGRGPYSGQLRGADHLYGG